jgi:hypothetical protein
MTYLMKLTPTAQEILRNLEPDDQREIDRVLRRELMYGPNSDKESRFDGDGNFGAYAEPNSPDSGFRYTATLLSYKAYTAIHRPMTKDELRREAQAAGQATAHGFYVFDILPADSAFERSPHGLAAPRAVPPVPCDLPAEGRASPITDSDCLPVSPAGKREARRGRSWNCADSGYGTQCRSPAGSVGRCEVIAL